LTACQVIALEENLPRFKALDDIAKGNYDPTNHSEVYRLWLVAYEDEDQARRAQSQAVQNLIDKTCGKLP